MRTIKIFFLLAILFLSTNAFSQDKPYSLGVGLRLGSPLAVSLKKFVSEKSAFEVYAGFRGNSIYNWISLSGAYLVHTSIDDIEGLGYYIGGGASVYIYSYDDGFFFDDTYSTTAFGIQGYAGLEYTFADLPLSITADWIPTLFIGNGYIGGFGAGYGTLGVRYVIR